MAKVDEEDQSLEIATSYLLVSDIPLVQDKSGRYWADRLWWTDLVQHCRYLKFFHLAAPVFEGSPSDDMVPLDNDATKRLVVVPLVYAASMASSLSALYENAKRLNAAVSASGVVHACYAGWPFPLSWIAQPLAMVQRKPVVAIIESMFSRTPDSNASLKNRVRGIVVQWLNWILVRGATVRIFSTEAYRSYFVGEKGGTVIPCSWVDRESIRSADDVTRDFSAKLERPVFKALFVGRLNEQKGIKILLDAAEILEAEQAPVSIDILGDGPMKPAVLAAGERMSRVSYLIPVPYGPPLYGLLRGYDIVVVPSLSDEQPRIVFDAYSQGVPVLASRTTGLMECVRQGETGILVDVGHSRALAEALMWCAINKSELATLSLGGLASVRRNNIETMHSRRARLLKAYGIT